MSLQSLIVSALQGGCSSRRKQWRRAKQHTKKDQTTMMDQKLEDYMFQVRYEAQPESPDPWRRCVETIPSCATVKRCISPDGSTIMVEPCSTAQSHKKATAKECSVMAGADHSHLPLNKKATSRASRCRTRQRIKHMLSCVQHMLEEELYDYEDLRSVGW